MEQNRITNKETFIKSLLSANFDIENGYSLVEKVTHIKINNYHDSVNALNDYLGDIELACIISYELGSNIIISKSTREKIFNLLIKA